MASNKIQRVNEEIQRELAMLLRQVKDPRVQQGLISILAVDTTPDLRQSRVYLSVLGLTDEKQMVQGLQSASGFLRRELGRKLQLRYTPELQFQLDRSIEHGARISKLLSGMEVSGADEPDETCEQ